VGESHPRVTAQSKAVAAVGGKARRRAHDQYIAVGRLS